MQAVARQARSEATRRKIIDAAVDLFNERGYAASGLGEIIDRVEKTKGALYYHFDSKESLACAIIDEGAATVLAAFDTVSTSPAPALESLIHGVFVVSDLLHTDKLARTGIQLARTMGDFADAASRAYSSWHTAMGTKARLAQEQGDLREDIESEVVAELVITTLLGAELISTPVSAGSDLTDRLTRLWQVVLPAVAAEASLPYFLEYLARESMSHRQPALTI
jgi:AcrR family transcriptional regulator